jgi:hypothetical protein
MIDTQDLCRAVRTAVEIRRKNRTVPLKPEIKQQEAAVYDLFSSQAPRFERVDDDFGWRPRVIDVRFRSRVRVRQLLNRKAGTEWRQWDIRTLIDWILENWQQIISVLLTLIMLII